MNFTELNIYPPILKALAYEQYTEPTPIQEQAIPHALQGRDLLGVAQTGTGKTAAFAVPILQNLDQSKPSRTGPGRKRPIRALILTPTRELALQIQESFEAYGRYVPLKAAVIYGGVSQKPQEDALRQGVDILVATPGRLKDLMQQGLISLSSVEILTLDEADRMLDMGFIHDVRQIIAQVPKERQTLFFSATMPEEIVALSRALLHDPVRVSITPESLTVDIIEQSVYLVDKINKRHLLLHLLKNPVIESALVFTRTKHGADRVVRDLVRGGVNAQAIHGNKSQNARQRALAQFKDRTTRVLVATDIAARGLDIEELSHVINFDLPEVSETYVHRIGRTGRAGLGGTAISFCDRDEIKLLKDIEKLIGKAVPKVNDHPFPMSETAELPVSKPEPERRRQAPAPERTVSRQRTSRGRQTRPEPSGPQQRNRPMERGR
ncbi:MAG: DEAD/DEAH box helicase [Eubacteriales bacterium]|nr:DEAD/DEAH box helicase [Eubacteriales bacterium]